MRNLSIDTIGQGHTKMVLFGTLLFVEVQFYLVEQQEIWNGLVGMLQIFKVYKRSNMPSKKKGGGGAGPPTWNFKFFYLSGINIMYVFISIQYVIL